MINAETAPRLFDAVAHDRDGDKIGKVAQVYLDDQTGQPAWVTVRTGMLRTGESFAPLSGAVLEGEVLRLPVTRDAVKDAPRIDDREGHLSPEEEQELYRYYGLEYAPLAGYRSDAPYPGPQAQSPDEHRAGSREPAPGSRGEQAMTRSEERLKVGTEQVEAGRVRLRKYVVTEQQQLTVPVRHEEVRLEREPITDPAMAAAAPIGEEQQEVTLHAERPVVDKEAHAVERVRLGTETVTEDQTVSDEVRKERVEVDDDSGRSDTGRDAPPEGRHWSR